MEITTIAIILIVIGVVLLIAEAFSPGGYLVIPGVVLVVVGVFAYLMPDEFYTWWTPALIVITTIPVTAVTILLYRRLAKPAPPVTTVTGSLVGKEGIVVTEIQPGNMTGKVKIGSDTWSATADETISEGSRVTVESSEGVHVHVRKL